MIVISQTSGFSGKISAKGRPPFIPTKKILPPPLRKIPTIEIFKRIPKPPVPAMKYVPKRKPLVRKPLVARPIGKISAKGRPPIVPTKKVLPPPLRKIPTIEVFKPIPKPPVPAMKYVPKRKPLVRKPLVARPIGKISAKGRPPIVPTKKLPPPVKEVPIIKEIEPIPKPPIVKPVVEKIKPVMVPVYIPIEKPLITPKIIERMPPGYRMPLRYIPEGMPPYVPKPPMVPPLVYKPPERKVPVTEVKKAEIFEIFKDPKILLPTLVLLVLLLRR